PFDLRRAAETLELAGWIDADGDGIRERQRAFGPERLVVRVHLANTPDEIAPILERFDRDARQVGIAIEYVNERMDDGRMADELDGWFAGWGHDWEDDPFQVFHSSQVVVEGSNRVAYRSDEVDGTIEALLAESSLEQRVELHHELHRILHRDQPYTFLAESLSAWAVSDRVHGVRFQINQPRDLSFGWWIEEPR